jgi:hypothetical protein
MWELCINTILYTEQQIVNAKKGCTEYRPASTHQKHHANGDHSRELARSNTIMNNSQTREKLDNDLVILLIKHLELMSRLCHDNVHILEPPLNGKPARLRSGL